MSARDAYDKESARLKAEDGQGMSVTDGYDTYEVERARQQVERGEPLDWVIYDQEFARQMALGNPNAAPDAALATHLRQNGKGSGAGSGPRWGGRFKAWSVKELLATDLTLHWDISGMLIRPTYGADAGEMKTLKSYLGLSRSIGLAAGVPVLGHWAVPERRRVLTFIAEGGQVPYTRRLHRLAKAHEVEPDDLEGWLIPVFDAAALDSVTFLEVLETYLTEFEPHLVYLDPLYSFQPKGVNTSLLGQMGEMLVRPQLLCADHGATFWLSAHMNQTGQGFDLKRITGAGVAEWVDSWTLMKHRRDPNVEAGLFKLHLEIGSRQWGGSSFDVDFNLGSFNS